MTINKENLRTVATGTVQSGQRRAWVLTGTLWILWIAGCSGGSSQDPQDAGISQKSDAVTPDASPREVAEVALKAIVSRDKDALRSLVAVRKVREDVEAITQGRAAFQGMVDKAIPTAVSAIMSEVNWLDAEGRQIDEETVTGTTAVVTVKGKRDGKEQTRRFFLVQEDSQWRLVPSHR